MERLIVLPWCGARKVCECVRSKLVRVLGAGPRDYVNETKVTPRIVGAASTCASSEQGVADRTRSLSRRGEKSIQRCR
jgi:hypothetical protein